MPSTNVASAAGMVGTRGRLRVHAPGHQDRRQTNAWLLRKTDEVGRDHGASRIISTAF